MFVPLYNTLLITTQIQRKDCAYLQHITHHTQRQHQGLCPFTTYHLLQCKYNANNWARLQHITYS